MPDLIGFDSQLNSLVSKYKNNNLHPSIIFHGPKGIGKKIFIDNLVKEIFKINYNNNNLVHHINLYENNTHPNIKILHKLIDPKLNKIKTNITIDQIRNLKKFTNETSSIDNFGKFIIVDSADDLNTNSSNSLLKTLEEPKKNTFIFLISHQLSTLIPTIRSRCLKIKFNKHEFINFDHIMKFNINNISNEETKFYYDLTNGSPGNAINLYNEGIIDFFDTTLEVLQLGKNNIHKNNLIDNITKLDNDKFKSYLLLLKWILISLNKFKIDNNETNNYLSNKFLILKKISDSIGVNNIFDKFNFLSRSEADLFTYNLDKKLFMLRFFK